MYSLSIFFGPSPMPAQFLFKDKEKADVVFKQFSPDGVHQARMNNPHLTDVNMNVADDYGQQGCFSASAIHAVIIEDMDLGEESRIQRGLSQARGQANANKRAQSDPVIMAAQRGAGPSVLTPFGRNGFND